MILADKIIQLRKKNGWSQEELAEQLRVTRQSVSKWEGAQSIPDLERILQMSQLFGVSTDYLLKDEMEDETKRDVAQAAEMSSGPVRRVSMEEAQRFLEVKRQTSGWIALATGLCILSPVCLFLMGSLSGGMKERFSENLAGGLGMIVMLLMVAMATAIYISCGMKTKPFLYLETENFETEYGVSGMVREQRQRFQSTYLRCNIVGVCMCILSAVPLFASSFMADTTFAYTAGLCGTLVIVALGVALLIMAGIKEESMRKLLQEGEYTAREKRRRGRRGPVARIYWCLVTALFLGYSLATNNWRYSWIVWVVAGVLFGAVCAAADMLEKKEI
ncbi:MAG: helix-turn-helix transcriptional regulator [Lachnospiraceae bacterium]|jgi:transcriptional regulator with XRE-family HTH domain|nr:helix-turn-helix transcriptional regulator [Lachnospiraceae bacterium]